MRDFLKTESIFWEKYVLKLFVWKRKMRDLKKLNLFLISTIA